MDVAVTRMCVLGCAGYLSLIELSRQLSCMFQHLMEWSPRIVVLACYSYQYYQQGCCQQPSVDFHFLVVIIKVSLVIIEFCTNPTGM